MVNDPANSPLAARAASDFGAETRLRGAAAWALVLLALAPFHLIHAAHFLRLHPQGGEPTGFLFADMPYYVANGRAIFERGNWFAYPNPYDPDTDSPVIYFHWYIWILGAGVVKLGLEPGTWFLATGAIAALAFGRLTLALVGRFTPTRRWQAWVFLVAMWGGGVAAASQVVSNVFARRPVAEHLLALDPYEGHWCLQWGRNVVYPTESLYHALVVAAWLAALRGRGGLATLFAALVAATHPFTGCELLAMLGLWWLWRGSSRRDAAWVREGALLGAVCLVFVGYNFGYLDRFEAHRELRRAWAKDWTATARQQFAGYGPVVALAAARVLRDLRAGRRLDADGKFMATAAATAFLLSNHQWFLSPHQPLHFTRGYVWLPLLLLGLPALEDLAAAIGARIAAPLHGPLAVLALIAASLDNIVFIHRNTRGAAFEQLYLAPGEKEVLREFKERPSGGIALVINSKLSYLATTYAPVRTWLGHLHNTPRFAARREDVGHWLETGEAGEWFKRIEAIATPVERELPGLDPADWEVAFESARWRILKRRTAPVKK